MKLKIQLPSDSLHSSDTRCGCRAYLVLQGRACMAGGQFVCLSPEQTLVPHICASGRGIGAAHAQSCGQRGQTLLSWAGRHREIREHLSEHTTAPVKQGCWSPEAVWFWFSRSLDSAQAGRRPISLSGCAGRLNTRSSVPRLVRGWPSLQGAWGTGACSLLGEGPETVMGRRDFVLETGSPTLGTRVQRSKSPRGAMDTRGYGHAGAMDTCAAW